MDVSLVTLVIAGYVFATSLRIPRPGPRGLVSDAELIALAVTQAITGLGSDRQFLGAVGKLLPGFFPHLPDQTQYNRRLRRLTPWTAMAQLMVAEPIAEGEIRLDGTLIACATIQGAPPTASSRQTPPTATAHPKVRHSGAHDRAHAIPALRSCLQRGNVRVALEHYGGPGSGSRENSQPSPRSTRIPF
jgi:hypothetical protein